VTLLDEVLPRFDFRERHAIRIDASAGKVFAALRAVSPGEMPVALLLFRLRGLRAAGDRPLLEQMGRRFETLAERPGRELVLGAVGQPWKLRGGETRPAADFASFDEPGFAKMVLGFHLAEGTLSTETRVLLTDAASRRRFRAYWLVIRPFSGLIRRLLLRAVKRRAERA
jgi:hypothetical protein